MVGALTDLLHSEKALAGGVLIVCATVLVSLGQMPIAMWSDFAQWIFTVFVAGKTIQGTAETLTKARTASTTTPDPSTTKEPTP